MQTYTYETEQSLSTLPSDLYSALEQVVSFTVVIGVGALGGMATLNDAMEVQTGAKFKVVSNELPTAGDYIIHGMVGITAGAGLGVVAGLAARQVLMRAGAAMVPGLGLMVAIGSGVGALLGFVSSQAVTRWGLSLKLTESGAVAVEFVPA